MTETIQLRGVRTHNLKNIDVTIPRDKLVVITGVSGSGKSSLAFDTLYAEGQRRYVESLSTYARQFLSLMEKPDLDHVSGLSPAISIEQKASSHNPRSTVGTITEIHDYLRLLFARVGVPRCQEHGIELKAQTVSQMVDQILSLTEGSKLMLLAPVVKDRKGEHIQLLESLRLQGFVRARINGEIVELDAAPDLDLHKKHTIEVVIDRLKVRKNITTRLAESLSTALHLADDLVTVALLDEHRDISFSAKFACPECGYSLTELEPRLFSFNNPLGACTSCDGLGSKSFFARDRIVIDSSLSLNQGAIRGWDKRNAYYFSLLASLAEHYQFSMDTPFCDLEDGIQTIILQGSQEKIPLKIFSGKRGLRLKKRAFEGVLPTMERRYRETESETVREELAKYLANQICPDCQGGRLNTQASHVFINNVNLPALSAYSIKKAQQFFNKVVFKGKEAVIAEKIVEELRSRLNFLINVGLDYLTLSRSADTLSGGEAQRIRLASQIGAGLVGVMYVLDEPSIGLHQRDNGRLLATLTHLRDLGNTVIVVEHDEEAIAAADYIIDIGPGAGVQGGEVVAQGSVSEIKQVKRSLTGQYLKGEKLIAVPKQRTRLDRKCLLRIEKADANNLKEVTVDIPIGLLTCITGVSGSGKSTLINQTLYPQAARELNGATQLQAASHKAIHGLAHFDKVIDIDQSPIGRTPRSNPATYTGMFTLIRDLFAATEEARSRGYQIGRFSFNVKGGRCEACQGDGVSKVEMHFLSDIYVVCDVCQGKRYNRETLEIRYKGKTIADVLAMTVFEASEFFAPVPALARKIKTLMDVGLSYISLGQSATTLSGGEAQRVKLAKELSKRDTGRTLYILDEPTTGLHFHDIAQLLTVLHHLRDKGNTIVIIEHNLDVIKTADWIIDLGPEGGDGGGCILASGTPEQIANAKDSYTGQYLRPLLGLDHD